MREPRDFEDRPGRGSSLREHLPNPGLDFHVGEGGAATSPGQAVGAGTAFPLRRNLDQMVNDLTSAMLIADLSLLVAWQQVRGIGDPVEAHRDMVDKETGRTQEPPEEYE